MNKKLGSKILANKLNVIYIHFLQLRRSLPTSKIIYGLVTLLD